MHHNDPLEALGLRMRRLGLPGSYVARTLGELAEHRDDLRAAAEEQGLASDAAEEFAAKRLGSLKDIERHLILARRRAHWAGRHPILAFCLLPLITFFAAFVVAAWIVGTIGEWLGWWAPSGGISADGWSLVTLSVYVFHWGLSAAVPFWFCWLARATGCGFRWAFVACLIFGLHGLVHAMDFVAPFAGSGGSLALGYNLRANLAGAFLPFVVFGLFWILCRHVDAHEIACEQARS